MTSGPVALVTGASSGIGAAAAGLLASRGFRVFGASRRGAPADPRIEGVRMDVTDEAAVAAGVADVLAAAGRIDALVCAAGYGVFGSVEETTLARARAQLDTNFFGVLGVVRAVLPGMRARGAGRIVVVGSLAGRAPVPFLAHYSASKAALDALVLALRNELDETGVRATLVEPGDVRTAFNEGTDWGEPGRSVYGDRIKRAEHVVRAALPRAPGPEAVAAAILRAL
ncbi:MAG TPA: SDR family NAD(P)-dependent oxidoreductase, partial [Vicinamibacteria bacterium]|nr:SDR family NAD(P)-dependent oxidoreductase [Vicinamibacteria bacterium]